MCHGGQPAKRERVQPEHTSSFISGKAVIYTLFILSNRFKLNSGGGAEEAGEAHCDHLMAPSPHTCWLQWTLALQPEARFKFLHNLKKTGLLHTKPSAIMLFHSTHEHIRTKKVKSRLFG
jgi:hypothetical protein